jgi:glycosidase
MPKTLVRAAALLAGLSLLATPNLAWSASAPKGPTAAEAAALARDSVRSSMAADNIYFVMTDRYANGDTSNDRGGLTGDLSLTGYDPTSDSYSHGGDLKGLTGGCTTGEGVARIKKLGFTTIWVTPPFKQQWIQGDSAAYHGYWINDFLNIDPHWGTNADFKTFVDCAHSQGIKVVLDIVMNHTGDVISYNGSGKAAIPAGQQNAKNPAWLNKLTNYHNRGDVKDWNDKFWAQNGDFFGLDDIKTENQEVIDGFAAVYSQWVNDYGVDGFRVDTAKHVDDAFLGKWWPKVVAATKAKNPNVFAFGEVFDSSQDVLSAFVRQRGLPSVLDFGFQTDAVLYAGGDGDAGNLLYVLKQDDKYTTANRNAYNLVTFLGNHDMGRVAYLLLKSGAKADTLLASTLFAHDVMYLTRGTPSVYYGDEVGMIGFGGDKAARQDMFSTQNVEWQREARVTGGAIGTKSALTDNTNPILVRIQKLNELRVKYPALSSGAQIVRGANGPILVSSRIDAADKREYLVGLNNANTTKTISVKTSSPLTQFTSVWGDAAPVTSDASGVVTVTVGPQGAAVLRADAQMPQPAAAVKPVLRVAIDKDTRLMNLTATLATADPATVSFAVKVGTAKTWTYIGSDDAASFALFWEYAKQKKGTSIQFVAISKTTSGLIATSDVKVVKVP